MLDYWTRSVLVTGGTKSIGLAFGRRGAQVYLTQKWGSADAKELISNVAFAPLVASLPDYTRRGLNTFADGISPIFEEQP